ncbi:MULTISPECIES: hypothetical protein [Bacillus]|nr:MULTISPECIES: hypothetical protein [Bacillus]MBW3699451.1 hypothetical protein [Bacillus aerophilus]APJ13225.1 hypothetical protein BSL056_08580 [Bacillus safensis]MCP9283673.1 hypothetical protein [Bacillus safensis]MCY7500075.1 hypothetical protein [Bacillus pumilus]MCY7528601.1 hypothetical protein [Bacillus pumilus]
MADGNYDVLKLEIDHIKNNIRELEADRKIMMKTNQTLSENVVRITTLLENQATNINEQNRKIDTNQQHLNNEIAGLRNELQRSADLQTKWYQDFLSSASGQVFKILLIVVLGLLGANLAGVDIMKLFGK